MSSATVKRTGRKALCDVCSQWIYEGTVWSETTQWFHENEPRHEVAPKHGTIITYIEAKS